MKYVWNYFTYSDSVKGSLTVLIQYKLNKFEVNWIVITGVLNTTQLNSNRFQGGIGCSHGNVILLSYSQLGLPNRFETFGCIHMTEIWFGITWNFKTIGTWNHRSKY